MGIGTHSLRLAYQRQFTVVLEGRVATEFTYYCTCVRRTPTLSQTIPPTGRMRALRPRGA